jgi:transcriptional regulator with XRE-family HTH domain
VKSVRIGGKLRRMRQERHMTQTQMAAELGLSPSYLNLIESNQRPVTVRVLLKLAERFQVELSTLAPEDDERLSTHLLEVFSDPLFDGADVKTSDVRDLVSGLPAVAHAIVDLYEAFRRRVSVLGSNAAGEDASESGATGLPSEEITEFLQRRLNHFPQLEDAAEALWVEHGLALHTLHQDLINLLSQRFAVDVEIAPSDRMRGELRRYNPLNRRLELSEMLALPSRTFQLAHQLAFLALRNEIEAIVSAGKFLTPEADALARATTSMCCSTASTSPSSRSAIA